MMKNWISLFLLVIVPAASAWAGKDPKYPVSDIPEELLKNAHVVYRIDKAHFTIEAIDKATFKIHKVITVLNKTGDGHAYMASSYDQLRKITSFSAVVYDKNGEEIDKLKKSEIVDRSYIDGGTLYDDSRVMSADLTQKDYPYTVDYEIEMTFKYLYSIPDWVVQDGENDAVQFSEYKVSAPAKLRPRFKQINFTTPPSKSIIDGLEEYTWTFDNMPAVKYELMSKAYLDESPIIRAAVSKFKYEDYEGSMESWGAMAKWQNSLNDGRNDLPESRKTEVKAMVADLNTDREKIKAIYEYMQNKTRYVSIQLGIGGFQPFESSIVDEKGYGDCKALSFYTKSLLDAVGIEAYYTWVYGGSNPPEVDPNFPNDTFNHIILCVPTAQDTIWLECTSQTNPMGYLGTFTGDRDVFVITENGGEIVHTPVYKKEDNAIRSKASIVLDEEGNARTVIKTNFIGMGSEYKNIDTYFKYTETEHKKWLNENIPFSNFKIFDYKLEEKKAMIPEITLDLDLGVRKLASVSSKRIFFTPNVLNNNVGMPPKDEDRRSPIYINNSRLYQDSITFQLPADFHIEFLPETTEISSDFGKLKVRYQMNPDGTMTYEREFYMNKGKYPAERYQEFLEFFKKVSTIDNKKVVLTKST